MRAPAEPKRVSEKRNPATRQQGCSRSRDQNYGVQTGQHNADEPKAGNWRGPSRPRKEERDQKYCKQNGRTYSQPIESIELALPKHRWPILNARVIGGIAARATKRNSAAILPEKMCTTQCQKGPKTTMGVTANAMLAQNKPVAIRETVYRLSRPR